MSVALVTQVIQTFLTTPTPQVLCIRGKWGVGKTYIWDKIRKQSIADGTVALPFYAYVSLFGLQNIDEVRQSIFENSVPTTNLEFRPDLTNLGANLKRYSLAAGRQFSRISSFAKVPYVDKYISNFSGGFRQLVSLTVRETIICFDDFERKKISAKDLLGLASQFREQKQCKVVIILNEDALSDQEKSEFARYFEKVVEIPIEFSPTPDECAAIAIKDTDFVSLAIIENIVRLGISNIRIIYRIKDAAERLLEIVGGFNQTIQWQALHTLTLAIWSKYDDGSVPLNIVRHQGESFRHLMGEDTRSEDEKKWNRQLNDYGFGRCDELDSAIIAGVEKGFFDNAEIEKQAQEESARHEKAVAEAAVHQAWRNFVDTFDTSNIEELAEGLYDAYRINMRYVTARSLDEALVLLKKLGFVDKASELVPVYVAAHRDDISNSGAQAHPFQMSVNDEDLKQALAAEMSPPSRVSAKDALLSLYQGKICPDEVSVACALSTEDLYELFSTLQGDHLDAVIRGGLFFHRVRTATREQTGLADRAIEALSRLGREHPANAIRVKRFGVDVGV